jgi:hypothetical protein
VKQTATLLIALVAGIFMRQQTVAQAPEKISYQAVIRNASDELIKSSSIGMQISILQGSATGTAVSVERHYPTTNVNGLVSIEIGGGTVVSGSFAAINWANGPYFIKTETDPNGGAIYTITGTSQILCVPYALYAKTAENGFSGDYNDLTNLPSLNITDWNTAYSWGNHSGLYRPISYVPTWSEITGKPTFTAVATSGSYTDLTNKPTLFDGTWTSLIGKPTTIAGYGITDAFNGTWASLTGKPTFAAVATSGSYTDLTNKPTLFDGTWASLTGKPTLATVATSGSYTDLTNKPNTDGSETKVTAGTNITVTGSGTIASPYVVNTKAHYIGESYGGGIVYYVYDNGQHGLIAAITDQSLGITWYNGTYRYTGTTGDGLGAGSMNTAIIVSTQISDFQTGNFAAKVCTDYSVTVSDITYGDWYLPSKFELNLLYLQKSLVGGFVSSGYWSSTESDNSSAWAHAFGNGLQLNLSKGDTYCVRPVRAF